MPALDEGMPFMVTAAMKQRLQAMGYSAADISDMRPADAHAILTASPEGQQPAHAGNGLDFNSPPKQYSASEDPDFVIRPVALQGDLRNLPAALAPLIALPNWVGWKWEWKTTKRGEGKWTKPPINAARTNEYAKTNDPQSWTTYERALNAFEAGQVDGIGFCLFGTEFAAFDIDHCRDPQTGLIVPVGKEIVDRAASYTEITVSGTGLRVIGLGTGAEIHRKQTIADGVEVETYRACKRYIVISGNPLPNTWPHLANIDAELNAVVGELDQADKVLDFNRKSQDSLPPQLNDLIHREPPPDGDLSAAFHHAVCWLGDLGWSSVRIEGLIAGKPIVPERYANRLAAEIERCLRKAKPKAPQGGAEAPDAQTGTNQTGGGAGNSTWNFSSAPGGGQSANPPLILTSRQFVDQFKTPNYLVDGIMQRGFFYSLTAVTGVGKTAIALLLAYSIAELDKFGDLECESGKVLYLVGENPDDIQMRWIGMGDHYGFDERDAEVYFIPGVFDIEAMRVRIAAEVEALGGVALIIIDTSAAYFPGDDENSNVENGAYARMQRTLVKLAGHPTVLALCHPVKHAAKDNLLPRGGGAYLNEVDGNLTAYGDRPMAEMHWQGKFRGADFDPIHFEMITVKSPRITDAKGRIIPTVAAKHLSAKEQSERVKEVTNDQDLLMVAMLENDGASISDLAAALGWLMANDAPYKSKVQKLLEVLAKDKVVSKFRNRWTLTPAGKKAADKIKINHELAGARY